MAYIERALQSVPDRDSSSQASTDESSSSGGVTPVTNTVLDHHNTSHHSLVPGTSAAFSPYTTTYHSSAHSLPHESYSRRSTPGTDLQDIPTLSTIGTAPSTPRSGQYTKTKHKFSVAPEQIMRVDDPKLITPREGIVSLAPTTVTAHISGKKLILLHVRV